MFPWPIWTGKKRISSLSELCEHGLGSGEQKPRRYGFQHIRQLYEWDASAVTTPSPSKTRKKNERRPMVRKKAFEVRRAAESTDALASASPVQSRPAKFMRTRNGRKFWRGRRKFGGCRRKNKRRDIRGWRSFGLRGKWGKRRSWGVRRKRDDSGTRCKQKFTFNVTEENYRSFRDQVRGWWASEWQEEWCGEFSI